MLPGLKPEKEKMMVEQWSPGGWSEFDAFMNDKRHCGQGWVNNKDVTDPVDHDENRCDECGSTNIRFQHYEDCIDGDYEGTEVECFDCGVCYIS